MEKRAKLDDKNAPEKNHLFPNGDNYMVWVSMLFDSSNDQWKPQISFFLPIP